MLTEAQAAQIEKIREARKAPPIIAKTPKPVDGIGACHRCGKPTVGRLCKRCKGSEPKPEPKLKVETVGPVNVTVSEEPKAHTEPEVRFDLHQIEKGLKELLRGETEVAWNGKDAITNGHWLIVFDDDEIPTRLSSVNMGNKKGTLRFDGTPKCIGTRFGGDDSWGTTPEGVEFPEYKQVIPNLKNYVMTHFRCEGSFLLVFRNSSSDTYRCVGVGENPADTALDARYVGPIMTMCGTEPQFFPSHCLYVEKNTKGESKELKSLAPVVFKFNGMTIVVMPMRI